jgi:hypothetical protein
VSDREIVTVSSAFFAYVGLECYQRHTEKNSNFFEMIPSVIRSVFTAFLQDTPEHGHRAENILVF